MEKNFNFGEYIKLRQTKYQNQNSKTVGFFVCVCLFVVFVCVFLWGFVVVCLVLVFFFWKTLFFNRNLSNYFAFVCFKLFWLKCCLGRELIY